jgi:spermidine synthase
LLRTVVSHKFVFRFLDGIVQSLYSSEETYHEALVQPAMFAHYGPKRVGVLGGGEGATIREVLKHNTVESVTMIELDDELIAICREYLPKMSNCSDITGRADNCFDDEAVEVVVENAINYFYDRHGPNPTAEVVPEPFDVLIVDALDPEGKKFAASSMPRKSSCA